MISISAIEEEAVHVLVFLGFSITETENRKIYKKMLPLPTIEPILQSFCPMLSKPHSSKSVLGILDAQLGKSLESRQHRHKIQVIQARLNCLGCIILFG